MKRVLRVIYDGFIGVVNSRKPWELSSQKAAQYRRKLTELVSATNFDIDEAFKLKMRPGRIIKLSGNYSDLWTDGTGIYANKAGDLVFVSSNFATTTVLKSSIGTTYRVSYAKAGDVVVWTNYNYIEYIQSGGSHSFPTQTEEFKESLPAGQLVEYYKGKLLIARDNVIWQSDPLARRFGALDKRGNSRQLAGDVLLLKAVDDGIWVSDANGIYFAHGPDLNEMNLTVIENYPALIGGAVRIDGTLLEEPVNGTCHAIATTKGICIIGSSAYFKNLTEKDYNMLSGTSAAMLFKQTSAINQIVTIVRS